MKTVILTADNLGLDISANRAIFEAFHAGTVQSASLLPNGEAFDDASKNVVNSCPELDIGIQLNILEGKSLITNYESFLTAEDGYYNISIEKLFFFSGNKKYLTQIEFEFSSQINKILENGIKPVYLASSYNIHAIPGIFEITCRLANKYNIPYIRTQTELPYFAPEFYRHLEGKYFGNAGHNLLLNTMTWINQSTLKKYNIKTNDYYIGVLYSNQMDKNTIVSGIKQLPKDSLTEIVFHPSSNKWKHSNYLEYKVLVNNELKQEIEAFDTRISTWSSPGAELEKGISDNTEEGTEAESKEESTSAAPNKDTRKYETVVHSITVTETDIENK